MSAGCSSLCEGQQGTLHVEYARVYFQKREYAVKYRRYGQMSRCEPRDIRLRIITRNRRDDSAWWGIGAVACYCTCESLVLADWAFICTNKYEHCQAMRS